MSCNAGTGSAAGRLFFPPCGHYRPPVNPQSLQGQNKNTPRVARGAGSQDGPYSEDLVLVLSGLGAGSLLLSSFFPSAFLSSSFLEPRGRSLRRSGGRWHRSRTP